MKNSVSKIAIATLLTFTGAASLAASALENFPNNISAPYLMAGGGLGAFQSASSSNSSGFMGQIGGGYLYALPSAKNISVGGEIGGMLYPTQQQTFIGTTETITSSSINLLGVVRYFTNDKFALIGKIGPSFFRGSSSVSGPGAYPNSSASSTGLMIDAGVAYNLTPALALTGDFNYSWQSFNSSNSSQTFSPYGILVGVSYNFADMVKK